MPPTEAAARPAPDLMKDAPGPGADGGAATHLGVQLTKLAPPLGRLQAVRHEKKYAATPEQADIVRQRTLQHLGPDGFTKPVVNKGYAILTLNLDSPNLDAFQKGERKSENYEKLRIRMYGDAPTTAFLEVKGKRNGETVKLRVLVNIGAVDRLLSDPLSFPTEADLVNHSSKEVAALNRFNELARLTRAVPQTFTACMREGFEPEDGNEQRITIDHQLRVSPFIAGRQPPPEANWQELDSLHDRGLSVVIEFKYVGDQMPEWMAEAIEAAGIGDQRFSSKYRSSVKQVRKNTPAQE